MYIFDIRGRENLMPPQHIVGNYGKANQKEQEMGTES